MEKIIQSVSTCKLLHELLYRSVCMRCALRFLRVETIDLYRNKMDQLQLISDMGKTLQLNSDFTNAYDIESFVFRTPEAVIPDCLLCLGILQKVDRPEYVQKLAEDVIDSKYEFETFKLTIKQPLSPYIRYAHMAHYLKYQFEEVQKVEDVDSLKQYFNPKDALLDIKTVMKWILAPLLREKLNCSAKQDERFTINIDVLNDEEDREQFNAFKGVLQKLADSDAVEKIKKKVKVNKDYEHKHKDFSKNVEPTKENLNKILSLPQSLFLSVLSEEGQNQPPKPTTKELKWKTNFVTSNIYIFGNYLKYSRVLSQTPWEVEGKKMYETSIQDEIANVIRPHFDPTDVKFHSGGREDVDVRCLGNGRPFTLELINPKRYLSIKPEDLQAMEAELAKNPHVNVKNIRFHDETCFEILKASETEKIKAYSCVVNVKKKLTPDDIEILNNVVDLKVQQKTPLRVLHRRTLMVREKMIHRIKARQINDYSMVVNVLASAGTYIKEFVHGDLDRTLPNLGTLIGTDADIIQLDVIYLYEKMDGSIADHFLTL